MVTCLVTKGQIHWSEIWLLLSLLERSSTVFRIFYNMLTHLLKKLTYFDWLVTMHSNPRSYFRIVPWGAIGGRVGLALTLSVCLGNSTLFSHLVLTPRGSRLVSIKEAEQRSTSLWMCKESLDQNFLASSQLKMAKVRKNKWLCQINLKGLIYIMPWIKWDFYNIHTFRVDSV